MSRSKVLDPQLGLVVLALLTSCGQAVAHPDHPPDGPPPITPWVRVEKVTVLSPRHDGVGGILDDFELDLFVTVSHEKHNTGIMSEFKGSVNVGYPVWTLVSGLAYEHQECSPPNKVTIDEIQLVELDSPNLGNFLGQVSALAGGLAAAKTPAAAGPYGKTAAGAAVALTTSVAAGACANDDLGTRKKITIPISDPASRTYLTLTGRDGSAQVLVRGGLSFPQDEGQCNSVAPPDTLPTPAQRSSFIFPSIRGSAEFAPTIDVESGNPANLTPGQIDRLRKMCERFAVGMAQLLSASEIEDARGLSGESIALASFEAGQTLDRSGDPLGAIDSFRTSFTRAAEARRDSLSSSGEYAPFMARLAPDYLSIKSGWSGVSTLMVLGSSGLAQVSVTGVPAGMSVQATRLEDGLNLFSVSVESGMTPPGEYEIVLTAEDAATQVRDSLTVSVEAHEALDVGHPRAQSDQGIRVIPNPSTAGVAFDVPTVGNGPVRAAVYDLFGRRVATGVTVTSRTNRSVTLYWDGNIANAARAKEGLYHLRIAMPRRTHSVPFILLR